MALNPINPSCVPVRALLIKRLFNTHGALPRFKCHMLRIILKDYYMAAKKGRKEGSLSTATALGPLTHPLTVGVSLALGC